MVVVVVWFSVLPFLAPALVKGHLANLKTMVDSNGICFQTTDYTCGPAAAVTRLYVRPGCGGNGFGEIRAGRSGRRNSRTFPHKSGGRDFSLVPL
jgi:hypothetical protein